MISFLRTTFLVLIMSWYGNAMAQSFPNPATLSTGQGAPGTYDPVWTVSPWYSTNPPNPLGLTYTPALINNNCAPGAWIDPSTLPPPVNNGNWITGTNTPCAGNTNDGYLYFRLTLNLPADCNGNSVATTGSYILYLLGYVDNSITDVFVNGNSTGINGGGFSPGTYLNFSLAGPWVAGLNYVDIQVYNTPNGGNNNPYGLLLVANSSASSAADGDGDGIPDLTDQCPCTPGPAPSGCPPASITGNNPMCIGGTETLTASGGGTYLWSDNSTNATLTVNPTTTTTYSVTTTQSTGYTSTASVSVVINQLPIPVVAPAAPSICIGKSITLTASGGTSYTWNTPASTAAITVSPTMATPYSVTVTDANNCSASTTVTVNVNQLPIPAISPAVGAICTGKSTTLTASGGTSYLWSTTAITAPITVSPTIATTYTVTVTDANTCSAVTSRTVNVNALPIPAINPAVAAICAGGSTTLTASGGTSYLWSTTAVTAPITVSPAIATTYSVTVTDANTCSATTSRTVTVNPLPIPAISPAVVAICAGGSTTLTASGGTSYAWNTPAATAAITVSPGVTTPYTVTVTDANNCSASITRSVTVHTLPTPAISPAAVAICTGKSTTLTASGGTNYLWSNTAVTAATTVSPTGTTTYSVTVTDANTCSAITSRTVTVNALPIPAINPAAIAICTGGSTTLTASGGTSYLWSNAAITAPITVSPTNTTTYSVTVTDANTCSATTSSTVTVNQLPIPAISPAVATICVGNNMTLTASGGTSYAWNTPAATAAITVSPGVTTPYTVTVTDANNCSASITRTVTVNQLPTPAINPASTAICTGTSTTLTASGGTSYLWSNTDVTAATTVSPTVTTTYSVTVTDANTCSAVTASTVTVNQLPSPSVNPSAVAICIGGNTTLTASGGTSYRWSNNDVTAATTVSPTITTTYSVTATDANTCTATASGTVTVNLLPIPAVTPSATAICIGGSTTLTASGGSSYLWSNTDNTAATNVTPAITTTYAVTVTDVNTCSATTSATVTVNQLPVPAINPASAAICPGGSTTLTASGGTSYLWSNTNNTAAITISPAAQTTYSVTVTDVNTCSAVTAATVSIYTSPTAVITPSATQICNGSSATLTASGGTSFLWNNGGTAAAPTVSPSTTTTYSVTVTDINTCTNSTSWTMTVIPTMVLSTTKTDVKCYGDANGSIDLTVSSGQSPYTYQWNVGGTVQDPVNLIAANYSVVVTDNAGCTATTSANIVQPQALALTSSFTNPTCATIADDGTITLNVNGGSLPYTFAWSNGATSQNLSGASPGNYSVAITDADNCTASTAFSLAYLYDFSIHATPAVTIDLAESTTLGYSVAGTSGSLTSIWSPASTLSYSDCVAPIASPGNTTLYQIAVKNSEGCTASDTVTVFVVPNYSIFIPNAFTPNGDGKNDLFHIYGNLKALKFLEVEVFNRWGETVFKSNDIDFSWDGTFKGTLLNPGIYIWQLKLVFINGHSDDIQKGSLTLIR